MVFGVSHGSHGSSARDLLSKVPQVTLGFWIIKVLATTVGETGGDALSMSLNVGYAISSLIFLAFFAVTLTAQGKTKRYHPVAYWAVVVATTTVGTTVSDFLDRTLGMGYTKSSIVLLIGVLLVLYVWQRATGRLVFENITSRKDEVFYWVTILVSNTLGTALGDYVASDTGLGFERGALVFSVLIGLVALARFVTKISPSTLFWAAYVLTRPLGATLGDTLTKPVPEGGLNLSRIVSSLVIVFAMMAMVAAVHKRQQRLEPIPELAD